MSASPGMARYFTWPRSPPRRGSGGRLKPSGSRYQRLRYMSPLSWTVSSTSTPTSRSQAGTSPRRPVAATTTSASMVEPSSRRRPTTRGTPVLARLVGDEHAVHADAGDDLDAGLGERRVPQHPLERGAPDGEDGEVLVARPHLPQALRQRHREPARGLERRQHVGEPIPEEDEDAGEEAVRLEGLRGAGPVGGERLLRVRRGRQLVALDDRHGVPGPAEGERGGEPTDAATDDDDPLHPDSPAAPRRPPPSPSWQRALPGS